MRPPTAFAGYSSLRAQRSTQCQCSRLGRGIRRARSAGAEHGRLTKQPRKAAQHSEMLDTLDACGSATTKTRMDCQGGGFASLLAYTDRTVPWTPLALGRQDPPRSIGRNLGERLSRRATRLSSTTGKRGLMPCATTLPTHWPRQRTRRPPGAAQPFRLQQSTCRAGFGRYLKTKLSLWLPVISVSTHGLVSWHGKAQKSTRPSASPHADHRYIAACKGPR